MTAQSDSECFQLVVFDQGVYLWLVPQVTGWAAENYMHLDAKCNVNELLQSRKFRFRPYAVCVPRSGGQHP